MNAEKIYLIGDIRYGSAAEQVYVNSEEYKQDFLIKLQQLMTEYGVIKLDVAIDPYNFN